MKTRTLARFALLLLFVLTLVMPGGRLPQADGQGVIVVKRKAPAAAPTGDPFLTSGADGALRNNFDGCVGLQFETPASPVITVNALGRWKVNGNSQSHTVSIKLADGTVVASAVVDLSGGTIGEYNYTSITPVALTPSTVYNLVSSEINGGDQWHDLGTYTDSGDVTLSRAAFQTGCAGAVSDGGGSQVYVPVNMKLQ